MKRLYLILILILCFCSGCQAAASPEATVKHFLNAAKEFDLTEMAKYVMESGWNAPGSDADTQELLTSFFRKTNSKMLYSIGNIKQTEERLAVVPVKVRYLDGTELFVEIAKEFQHTSAPSQTLSDTLTNLLDKESSKSPNKFTEIELELTCVYEQDTWRIQRMDADMLNVVTCNLASASGAF